MRRRLSLTIYLAVMAWMLVVPAAHAYVDPGTSSFLFQMVVAGLAAAGTAVTVFWSRLSSLFRRGSRDADTEDRADTGDAP